MKEGAIFISTRLNKYTYRLIPQPSTLYFAVRQVGHQNGNTRNRDFQLATILLDKLKKKVARFTGLLKSSQNWS